MICLVFDNKDINHMILIKRLEDEEEKKILLQLEFYHLWWAELLFFKQTSNLLRSCIMNTESHLFTCMLVTLSLATMCFIDMGEDFSMITFYWNYSILYSDSNCHHLYCPLAYYWHIINYPWVYCLVFCVLSLMSQCASL